MGKAEYMDLYMKETDPERRKTFAHRAGYLTTPENMRIDSARLKSSAKLAISVPILIGAYLTWKGIQLAYKKFKGED